MCHHSSQPHHVPSPGHDSSTDSWCLTDPLWPGPRGRSPANLYFHHPEKPQLWLRAAPGLPLSHTYLLSPAVEKRTAWWVNAARIRLSDLSWAFSYRPARPLLSHSLPHSLQKSLHTFVTLLPSHCQQQRLSEFRAKKDTIWPLSFSLHLGKRDTLATQLLEYSMTLPCLYVLNLLHFPVSWLIPASKPPGSR